MIPTRSIRIVLVTAVVLSSALAASAQTKGRIGVGGSVTLNNTTDSDVGTGWSFGPLVRINPRPGWRFASAFNWYNADLEKPGRWRRAFARFNIRPVMGGIGYTLGPPKTLVNFSVVMGPSFNRAYFRDGFPDAAGSSIEAKTSFRLPPWHQRHPDARHARRLHRLRGLHGQPARCDLPEQHRPAGPGSLARRFDRVERRHGLFGLLVGGSAGRRN